MEVRQCYGMQLASMKRMMSHLLYIQCGHGDGITLLDDYQFDCVASESITVGK